jgi:predicted small lipoprotein YifL
MEKKSIKYKMRKFNSITIIFFMINLLLTGCGMKGPLYQTPQKQIDNNTEQDQLSNNQKEN